MLFIFYLKEVKYRIFYCILSFFFNFLVWFFFAKELLFVIVKPLLQINKTSTFSYFIFTNMTDVLSVYIKIAFILGIVITVPVIFFQLWFFLVQGLYNYEKNYLFIFIIIFIFIIVSIYSLLYMYLIPFIWFFFINFELTSENFLFGVYYEAKINDYVSFMFYIFGIFSNFLFIPIIMVCSIYFNFLRVEFFINYRKYFIIFIFILGGLVSPPDIFSQIFISGIILIIYEIIIFCCVLLYSYEKKIIFKNKKSCIK